mgnify:CR=1 FL=1
MVHFVGAGSGAADLITVRGAKLLGECDVVIYAGSLVNPALLAYCRKDCRIYNSAEMTLEQVIDAIRKAEAAGETTVRLHTGDSSIFGAVREQFDELDKLGIAYDVCPGVSAFCGAAASLKTEYTLPDVSQTVIITRAGCRVETIKILCLFIVFGLSGSHITVVTDSEGYCIDSRISGIIIHLSPFICCRVIFPCVF